MHGPSKKWILLSNEKNTKCIATKSFIIYWSIYLGIFSSMTDNPTKILILAIYDILYRHIEKTDAAFDDNQNNFAEYMSVCFEGYRYHQQGKLSSAKRDEYQTGEIWSIGCMRKHFRNESFTLMFIIDIHSIKLSHPWPYHWITCHFFFAIHFTNLMISLNWWPFCAFKNCMTECILRTTDISVVRYIITTNYKASALLSSNTGLFLFCKCIKFFHAGVLLRLEIRFWQKLQTYLTFWISYVFTPLATHTNYNLYCIKEYKT